jgi:hypothetical protein
MNSYSTNRTGDFVTDGIMLALPLCFPGQSLPPSADETLIGAMAEDAAAMAIYLGTGGRAAHGMVAATHADTGVVQDLGVIPAADRVDAVGVGAKWVYFVASGPQGSALWSHRRLEPATFLIQEWGLTRGEFTKVCDLWADRRVAGAVFTPEGWLYGLTEGDGQFFKLDLSAENPKVELVGSVQPPPPKPLDPPPPPFFSSRLVLDRGGRVWGTNGSANLWHFDRPSGKLVTSGPRIPAAAGREAHTIVSAWAIDSVSGLIYGGTSPDGFFFKFDPERRQVTPLGKPTRLDEIHCLTVGHDGRVYGMAGGAEDIGHLFVYDPANGALADLGVPVSTLSVRQYGYHFRSALTAAGGEIYFGQHERASHLWLYFPPACRKQDKDGAHEC